MAKEGSIVEGVAGRYAAALFDLASEDGKVQEVERDLGKFQSIMDESADFKRMVRSPVIAAEDQARALGVILEKAGIGGLGANFFKLIAQNRRLFAAEDMVKAFRARAAKERGEVTAEVTSAVQLNGEQTAELKQMLKQSVGKDVTLSPRVDPGILGGLIVKVGSRMIDSSLRTKLQNLKVTLSGSST